MEKKKNIIIVILIIIIAILCGVIGWVLGNKFVNVEEDIIDIPSQEEENIDLDKVANNLLSRISGLYMCGEQPFDFDNDNKLTYEELDKDYINRFVVGSLFVDKKITNLEDSKYQVSAAEYKNEFTKVFGNDKIFEQPQTFYISYIKFDLVGDNYIGSSMAMGCEGVSGQYYLDSYHKENNNIYLNIYLLYTIGNGQYVLDPNIMLPIEDSIETYTKEQILENHKDKLLKYKYTFKIENDNYIFDSIERA